MKRMPVAPFLIAITGCAWATMPSSPLWGDIAAEFIYGGPHTLFSNVDRPGSPGTASAESASSH
jgi:hypothetical protein